MQFSLEQLRQNILIILIIKFLIYLIKEWILYNKLEILKNKIAIETDGHAEQQNLKKND